MKTPEECLDFIATWRYGMRRPSEEEFWEFCDSVDYYLSNLIKNNYNSSNNLVNKPGSFVRDYMVNMNMDDLKQTIEDCRISEDVPTIILDSIDSKVSENLGE